MSQPYSNVAQAIQILVANGAHSATKYVSPKHVIKVTVRCFDKQIPKMGDNLDFVVTIGRPNYADRLFIKQALKAGEPFPIKKLRLKYITKPAGPGKRVAVPKTKKGVKSLAAKVLGSYRAKSRG